jgi:hypothetical protein
MFDFARPLLDRFGADFFRAVPPEPGVYVFVGARGRVLYVGQSKNLRQRLAYYKNARPEREPRKIIRLVHQTQRIEIACCGTPECAQMREVHLIQARRPRFNSALAASRSYSFFGLDRVAGELTVRLSFSPEMPSAHKFGAFKNRGLCRRAFLALGRILWSENRRPASAHDLPLWLHERSRGQAWSVSAPAAEIGDEIELLMRGDSGPAATRAERLVQDTADPFLRRLLENDLLSVVEFGLLAHRMKQLRDFGGEPGLMPQSEVDPTQLRWRFHAQAHPPGREQPDAHHPGAGNPSGADQAEAGQPGIA